MWSFSNGFPTAQFTGVYANPVRNVILLNLNNRSTLTEHNNCWQSWVSYFTFVLPSYTFLYAMYLENRIFTPCSSIVDLESVRKVWTTMKERSDGKMIMKDGAMLDTFPSIPLLILPLILFQLYSTFQLRLLSVAHYLPHFSTFTLTKWNWQRPTVYDKPTWVKRLWRTLSGSILKLRHGFLDTVESVEDGFIKACS